MKKHHDSGLETCIDREVQRGSPIIIIAIQQNPPSQALTQKEPQEVVTTMCDGQVKGGGAELAVKVADACTMREQRPHHVLIATEHCVHDRCTALAVPPVAVCVVLQEDACYPVITILCRDVERLQPRR